MQNKNKPLLLRPSGKDYLWGGSRLNDEFEKSIKQAKQSADTLDRIMKDMKEPNSKLTLKRIVNISDDEKLLNFLRKISE